MKKGLKVVGVLVAIAIVAVIGYGGLYYRWKHLWAIAEDMPNYFVEYHEDDTLRVVMIGDSWAGLHSEQGLDSLLGNYLELQTGHPAKVVSKGKGGEKSREIYQLMFEDGQYGTMPLLHAGADYCIVMAGINDAAGNRGTSQYCHHMRLIIQHLESSGIKPVLVEIPDVDIWNIYGGKGIKDMTADWLRSRMTGCEMYHFAEYREALKAMLRDDGWMKRVTFVPMSGWNGEGTEINKSLFKADLIHLNERGYERLDSCIASAIADDLKQSIDTALVNEPVCGDAKNGTDDDKSE